LTDREWKIQPSPAASPIWPKGRAARAADARKDRVPGHEFVKKGPRGIEQKAEASNLLLEEMRARLKVRSPEPTGKILRIKKSEVVSKGLHFRE